MDVPAADAGPEDGGPAGEDSPRAVSPWAGGRWTWFRTPDRRLLVAAVLLQLVLAALFAHAYDMRVFLGTGHLVGTGQSPYVAHDLSGVFHHVFFDLRTVIGYPPPWPLALGAIERVSWALVPDLHLYAFAAKLPVVAAGIGLAYAAGAALQNLGAAPAAARRAWAALLFNPFVIYAGAVWGQIDALVALLALAALLLLVARRPLLSAALLGLAVCVKPTAAPLALAAVLFLWSGSRRQAAAYAGVCAAAVAALYLLPFVVLGWDATPFRSAGAQMSMQGALSLATVVRFVYGPLPAGGHWWLLGLAWIPALAVVVLFARRGRSAEDLLRNGAALVLVMFLTRTWLAEPNVVLVLPLVLVLAGLGALPGRAFTALWTVALLFTVANASPLAMLWLTWPHQLLDGLAWAARNETVLLALRAVVALAWQVAGWWVVVLCLRCGRPASA